MRSATGSMKTKSFVDSFPPRAASAPYHCWECHQLGKRMAAYFTGTTRVVDGTLLYQYRCPRGHILWSKMP